VTTWCTSSSGLAPTVGGYLSHVAWLRTRQSLSHVRGTTSRPHGVEAETADPRIRHEDAPRVVRVRCIDVPHGVRFGPSTPHNEHGKLAPLRSSWVGSTNKKQLSHGQTSYSSGSPQIQQCSAKKTKRLWRPRASSWRWWNSGNRYDSRRRLTGPRCERDDRPPSSSRNDSILDWIVGGRDRGCRDCGRSDPGGVLGEGWRNQLNIGRIDHYERIYCDWDPDNRVLRNQGRSKHRQHHDSQPRGCRCGSAFDSECHGHDGHRWCHRLHGPVGHDGHDDPYGDWSDFP
jgi:hypothetical protein